MIPAFLYMLDTLQKLEDADVPAISVAIVFLFMRTVAGLAMPETRYEQIPDDFIDWVNRYMRSDDAEDYRYRGIDLYAAHLALEQPFNARSPLFAAGDTINVMFYHEGEGHLVAAEGAKQVLIGVRTLIKDFSAALGRFFDALQADTELRARIERRLPHAALLSPVSVLEG